MGLDLSENSSKERKKVTVADFSKMKAQGQRIVMVTSYDYPTSIIADDVGVDSILVGDSYGMVVLGYDTTIPVTVEELLPVCQAVKRGASHSLLIGDMPFLSFQISEEDAIRNAGRFIKEGRMEAVKIEGGREMAHMAKAVSNAQPIFQTIQEIRDRGKTHIEITDLIVPEIGDNLDEARKLSRWLYDNLGPDVPVHFLRFHPDYKLMHLPSTPVKTLEEHCRIAREEGLRYVYVGNVTGHPWEHTYCPECKNIAVKRYGFDITGWNLDSKNRCVNCGYQLPIFGQLSSSVSEDRFLPVVN